MRVVVIIYVLIANVFAVLSAELPLPPARIPALGRSNIRDLSKEDKLILANNLATELLDKIFENRHKDLLYPEASSLTKKQSEQRKKDLDRLKKQKAMDTIAVGIDTNCDVYIAGNIKTRGERRKQMYEMHDFGFNEKDHYIILETLKKNAYVSNQRVYVVEMKDTAVDKFHNAKPHAEMQLKAYLNNNFPDAKHRGTVIAASKAVCTYCSAHLGTDRIHHSSEGGLKNVKNWYNSKKISDLGLVRITYVPSKTLETDLKEQYNEMITKYKLSMGKGCALARRKRSISSSCVFHFDANGDVKYVNPKQFVDEYLNAGPDKKRQMANIVSGIEDNHVFSSNNVGKLKQIRNLVQYEDLKSQHSKIMAVEYAQNSPSKLLSHNKNTANEIVYSAEAYKHSIKNLGSDVKFSPSKLSKRIKALTSTKEYARFAGGVSKVSNVLGKGFMAKSILSGILQNDNKSLAIIGARMGYEVITDTAVKVGNKYIRSATNLGKIHKAAKVGKLVKYVGQFAGPVGDMADIALGTYSLAKSVETLKNSTNKYDKYEAIAHVVTTSIDLVLSAASVAISIAFPPAAPVLAVVSLAVNLISSFAMAIFGAQNAVNRINSEITLLDFEKDYVYNSRLMDIFGTRNPDYLDDLVLEKQANEAWVQNAAKFLEKNQEFYGIVFPSLTFSADGNCKLYGYHCAIDFGLGCVKKEGKFVVAEKCERHRPCSDKWEVCEDTKKHFTEAGYDKRECKCDGNENGLSFNFDTPRKNSFVDLRNKQYIYWERAVPTNLQNEQFACKPGSKTFVHYKVSQQHKTLDYLCQNAIGVLQPPHRRKPGQILLFRLEDGNDTVDLSQQPTNYNYMFDMGNQGIKRFHGGGSRNDFVFNSRCAEKITGYFSGGYSQDSINLSGNCSVGQTFTVNFKQGTIFNENRSVHFRFSKIEDFIGREGQPDVVTADCSTRKIIGHGATNNQFDKIYVPEDVNCEYKLTIVAAKNSVITSKAQRGEIIIPISGHPVGVTANIDIHPKTLNAAALFLNVSSSQINLTKYSTIIPQDLSLGVNTGYTEVVFNYNFTSGADGQTALLFTEQPDGSPFSVLNVDTSGEALIFHTLPKLSGSYDRVGHMYISNIFEIFAAGWNAFGGSKNDEFILHTGQIGNIDGKEGTDTLRFHQNTKEAATIDLDSNKFRSIEKVIGAAGAPLTVRTACDTELVVTKGGSLNVTDKVIVSPGNCVQRPLSTLIVASGNTQVEVQNKVIKNDSVHIVVDGTAESKLKFGLTIKQNVTENLLVNIQLNHTSWFVKTTKCSPNSKIYLELEEVVGNVTGGSISFLLNTSINTAKLTNLLPFQVRVAANNSQSGELVYESSICQAKMIYSIDEQEPSNHSVIYGIGLENIFALRNTHNKSWEVHGGSRNNVFFLKLIPFRSGKFLISGSANGTNNLVMDTKDETNKLQLVINLANNSIGYKNHSLSMIGSLVNIHHIVVRSNAPDEIHATCETKSINGLGGVNITLGDEIKIYNQKRNCSFNLLTVVTNFTKVRNTATKGNFVYSINDFMTSSLELHTSANNSHLLQLDLNPWEIINDITFDPMQNQLTWKLSDGNLKRVQKFKMIQRSSSERFSNPIFQFASKDKLISSEIIVEGNGATVAVIDIQGNTYPDTVFGLPVDINRFLINATRSDKKPPPTIQGCTNNCSGNQYFIFSVDTRLEVLNGGDCLNSECSNTLYISETLEDHILIVNLDISKGSVIRDNGVKFIGKLLNINKLQGNVNTTAIVTNKTKQVSDVGLVIINQNNYPTNLILRIQEYTNVWFYEKNETNVALESTIHYRFSEPMSFSPKGSLELIQNLTHNYYLAFDLSQISKVWFQQEPETIYYTLHDLNLVYSHKMILSPDISEQFYSQPNLLTADGYRIQVAWDGSVWVTWAGTSTAKTLFEVPELQRTANRLGVTMLIQTPDEFYFIGHSLSMLASDRNVLQNVGKTISHLGGGRADDTIYEIVGLDSNIFLHTGFGKDDFENWKTYRNSSKQTVDMTDVIFPIRQKSQTKYVPSVKQIGDFLVITMHGYEKENPGKIYVVNGTKPWVSERIQLLLGHSMMDLVKLSNSESNMSNSTRNKRSIQSEWQIKPRPIILTDSIKVYSVAPEDLEDGQEIFLGSQQIGTNSTNDATVKFDAARSGNDLHLTNLNNMGQLGAKTLLLSGFYAQPGENDKVLETDRESSLLSDVRITLPGLSLVLNEKLVWKVEDENVTLLTLESLEPLKKVFEIAEDKLLEDFPDLPRLFTEQNIYLYVILTCLCLLLSACVVLLCIGRSLRKRGIFVIPRTKEKRTSCQTQE